jgi:hypothetical protein
METARRRTTMRKAKRRKIARLKTKLGLPDLEQAKSAVLASLRSPESQRSYRHSIDEFVLWYCSEPRLSFNKTVVTRYRIHLEDRQLAPGTVNVRLAAVRRLAYESSNHFGFSLCTFARMSHWRQLAKEIYTEISHPKDQPNMSNRRESLVR